MKYSKLPQWMRDKIFLEPDAEITIVFKYDNGPLEYWRNVGIIADVMGSYCHLLSSVGVYTRGIWETAYSYTYGEVRLSNFIEQDYPGLVEKLDLCLERLKLHGVEVTTYATAPGYTFNGKNTVDRAPLAAFDRGYALIGLYDDSDTIDWLSRHRQAQDYDPEEWPYDYMYAAGYIDDIY